MEIKKSSPRLPSCQPSLILFNTPIDSGSIIKPCTLKHFQVPILAPEPFVEWFHCKCILTMSITYIHAHLGYLHMFQMMTSSNRNIFRVTRPIVRGIHRFPVNSLHKGQWRGALMFSLICAWINDWLNNRQAGDLRLHRSHYDVNVIRPTFLTRVFISHIQSD